ncbi:MAG TPA: STAS domain-containing protein [Chitinophagaceae bacterium]|jgi:anti-anti-sigma regulatory factor|nr:STAS domain-containing protein [Chitinophagaceae bacterium]
MEVKIDTKEKFTVFTPEAACLSDNLTEELVSLISNYQQNDINNVVLNLKNVDTVDDMAAARLAKLQQQWYESNASFVICEIQNKVEEKLNELELADFLNITPTESEAWDIVQMEEIERELMDSDDILFNDMKEEKESD